MAGCVVVKPRSDIFRIHPAIFEVCPCVCVPVCVPVWVVLLFVTE
jgi:hypothetical protein